MDEQNESGKTVKGCLVSTIVAFVFIAILASCIGAFNKPVNTSANATPTIKPTPIITSTPILTPTPVPTPKQISFEEFKAECKDYDYQDVARNPDMYKGNYAHFRGQVIQVIEGNINTYRIYVTRGKYDIWSDIIFVSYKLPAGYPRILEKDLVDVYGVLNGLVTYKTVLGASTTVPAMGAQFIMRLPI